MSTTNQRLHNLFFHAIKHAMDVIIDTTPPPEPTSLRALIASLEPGQSLKTRSHSRRVVATTASLVKKYARHSKFKVADDGDGVRVWRLA